MEWKVERSGASEGCSVLLEGDCDLYCAPGFAEAMLALIRSGQRDMRICMAKVEYLDSTGVGSIVRIIKAMRLSGGRVSFSGVGGSPRRVLEMSNVLALMHVEKEAGGRLPGGL